MYQIYFYNRSLEPANPLDTILIFISVLAYLHRATFVFCFLSSPPRLITDFYIHSHFYFALRPYIFKFDAAFGRETGSLAGKEECTSPRDFDRPRRRVFSDPAVKIIARKCYYCRTRILM